ncbi:MAG: hypothetical protein IKZ59_02025 [Clostridia bacterium]|nr:hypothetical protein [Clostridia bacterium]
MNKLIKNIICVALCAILAVGGIGAAYALGSANKDSGSTSTGSEIEAAAGEETDLPFKDETVYVLAGADGSVKKIIVSDWLKNTLKGGINDKTELTGIENVKGNESYTLGENMAVWDADGGDIYYRGNIEKELPVGLNVSYKLDGTPISAEKIAGKSGRVTIRFDYENRQYETVNIGGYEKKIYVPFVMLTGMILDNDTFKNVEVSGGKFINDGDRTVVIGVAFPGLQRNLEIPRDILTIPDYVEITADAENFKFGVTVTVATNEIFNNVDTSKLDSADDFINAGKKLNDGMNQLLNGSSALYDGLCTLLEKSDTLISGINALCDGAKAISDGAAELDSGAIQLSDGISALSNGLSTLKGNSAALDGGAKQVFDTLLSTAQSQLTAAGLTVPELTTDNYADVLGGVIASLDEEAVYAQALSEVTAAVEANRAAVEAGVTGAVREQVLAQIIPQATGGAMDKESYDAAVSAGLVDSQTIAAINAAADAQMATDQVKALIAQNTEAQIQQLISANMASEAVTSKLAAASAGAQSVIALKTSLDSYNAFYLGLLSYTGGVDSAADGAAQLAAGATALKAGTGKLKDGAVELYGGALQLKGGVPALADGVKQLTEGAGKLKGGLEQFDSDGIKKITDLLGNDIGGVLERLKATVQVSKNYRNFSGIADGASGKVKFIYRTEEIN